MTVKVTRRMFLHSASLAAATISLSKMSFAERSFKNSFTPPGSHKDSQTVNGGICEMCFWRCQLVGKIRDKRLVKLEGNPKSIDNGTSICARGNAGIKLLYDPDRLKYPLKNIGERGKPRWKRISWQEALDECGVKLKKVLDKYGPQGIAMFPHGASARYPRHFFERAVGTNNISEASFFQCRGIRDSAYVATFGTAPGEHVDMANAKAILLIGCHLGENVHVSHVKRYLRGLQNGAKLVVVDPRFSASAAKSHIWVKIKPGTDTAFLLAIMNYLIATDSYDRRFVAAHCVGFNKFKKGIEHATLEWAAGICDVPNRQIKDVADLLAANAPHVSIHPGRHVSWHGNDFQRLRAHACLTALLGAIGVKGGFVKPVLPKIKEVSWVKEYHYKQRNLKKIADKYHFAPPGTPTELIRDACISADPHPIKGCVIWGQNSLHTLPQPQKTIDALKQMDFVLCVDIMPTDITMYADILLPESIYLERYDYIKTGTQWDFSESHQQFIAARMPLVDAMFESRDGVWITNELAKRMGYGDKIPVTSIEEKVNRELASVGLSIEQLQKEDGIHLQPGQDPYGVSEDFEVLLYNEDLEEYSYPGVPTFIMVDEVPKGFARLVYGRSPVHTFSRTQNNVWLHNAMPVNPVWLNDESAQKMGLKDGDEVSLINSEGFTASFQTVVKVTPGIRKDTVYLVHGFGSKNPQLTIGQGGGINDQELITKLAVDPETGCSGMRNNFVKLVKDGMILDIPS